jgi:hypothetical protein
MEATATHGMSWRKSSFSGMSDCVALRQLDDDVIGICNSRVPSAGILKVDRVAMADWLARIKAGAFDGLVSDPG